MTNTTVTRDPHTLVVLSYFGIEPGRLGQGRLAYNTTTECAQCVAHIMYTSLRLQIGAILRAHVHQVQDAHVLLALHRATSASGMNKYNDVEQLHTPATRLMGPRLTIMKL